jgi:transposase InsO family protein
MPIAITAQYNGQIVQVDLTLMPTAGRYGVGRAPQTHILTAIDVYSRYLWARALPNKQSASAIAAFRDVMADAKKIMDTADPFSIVECDQGSEFISREMNAFLDEVNIEMRFGDVGDKHFTGVIERVHKTLKEKIRLAIENEELPVSAWPQVMDDVVKAYNNTKHGTTGQKPIEVIQRRARPITTHQIDTVDLQDSIPIGSLVRRLLEQTNFSGRRKAFEPRWSHEIYQVKKRYGNKFLIGPPDLPDMVLDTENGIVNMNDLPSYRERQFETVRQNLEHQNMVKRFRRSELYLLPDGAPADLPQRKKQQLTEEEERVRRDIKQRPPTEIEKFYTEAPAVEEEPPIVQQQVPLPQQAPLPRTEPPLQVQRMEPQRPRVTRLTLQRGTNGRRQ